MTPGVPRGSVLGPALPKVSINDVRGGIKGVLSILVGDTKLSGVVTRLRDRAVQRDRDKLKQWPVGTSEV